jgi:hypothetical protein
MGEGTAMKTTDQLKIKQWELDRLLEVKKNLVDNDWKLSMGSDSPHSGTDSEHFCGSVVCLGGNMFALEKPIPTSKDDLIIWSSDMSNYVVDTHSAPLYSLFFPYGYFTSADEDDSWDQIPEAAVIDAIDIFLVRGKVRPGDWEKLRQTYGLKLPVGDLD